MPPYFLRCINWRDLMLNIQNSISAMKATASKAPRDKSTKSQPRYHPSQRNLRPCGHCARLQVRVRNVWFFPNFKLIYSIKFYMQCIVTPPLGSATLCHRCRKKGLTVCPPYTPRTKRLEPKVAVEEEIVLLQRPYADQDEPSSSCGSPQSEVWH